MNFEFIKPFPKFRKLYEACRNAEALAPIMPAPSCASSRSALEFVVNLIFRSITDASEPSRSLFESMNDSRFVNYVGDETIITAMHVVRKNGNLGAHGEQVSPQMACATLEQLHYVVGELFMNLKLIEDYPEFTSPLLAAYRAKQAQSDDQRKPVSAAGSSSPESSPEPSTASVARPDTSAPAAVAAKAVHESCSTETCTPSEEVVAEYGKTLRQTRFSTSRKHDEKENKKLFVLASLREAGWPVALNSNQSYPETACIGMTLEDGSSIDFILYGRDGKPLAVVDYSNAVDNPIAGRKHAIHAADLMERRYGYRPTAYYASGYRIFCMDPLGYSPRRVFGFHSLEELELLKQRAGSRGDISNPVIDDNITNRDYQKGAIRGICDAFTANRRRSVIVMATGTGKTRVSISLVDVLTKANWVKNVLFLADRTSLVRQAHKNFNKLLPSIPTSIFAGSYTERDKNARIIFATYQTMIRLVNGDNREFGIGRFDLIIVDEAHRSIFGKYPLLFEYFDSLMVGLTATPRCDETKSTYAVFDSPNGEPDYAYELEQAINDGYLVGFHVLDKTTEAMRSGISYDDLSDEEKEQIENAFKLDDDGITGTMSPGSFSHARIKVSNNIINRGTIDLMLGELMENGVKVDAGDKLGKTIIFASSHAEAEVIVEEFHKLYPGLGFDFCKLIDSQVDDALAIIDNLGERDRLPQIAVSVNMLDTGVDIPDAVNLVFFRHVYSKIQFLQMVGRGTRLSPDLFGPGADKKGFLIFDWYDNFRYFNTSSTWSTVQGSGRSYASTGSQGAKMNQLRLSILQQLQGKPDKTPFEQKYQDELYEYFVVSLDGLNNDALEVNRSLAYVNNYRKEGMLENLNDDAVEELCSAVVPLIPVEACPPKVRSFDNLVLTVENAYLKYEDEGKDPATIRNGFKSVATLFTERMTELQKLKAIPDVLKKEKLIASMMDGAYLFDDFTFERAEYVRSELRDLMKYIPDSKSYYVIDLADTLIDGGGQAGLQRSKPYAEKVGEYLQSDAVPLAKLRTLEPLTNDEKEQLKETFTAKLGSPADYAAWSGKAWDGHTEALAFLRKQIGISDEAIAKKLGAVLDDPQLTDLQRGYLRQIVGYAQANGDIVFKTLRSERPFSDMSVTELFGVEKVQLVKETVNGLHGPIND